MSRHGLLIAKEWSYEILEESMQPSRSKSTPKNYGTLLGQLPKKPIPPLQTLRRSQQY